MIFSGFPGIGKTSISKKENGIIDLESSFFPKNEDWYKNYVDLAIDLNKQGYDVFVSSHKEVRNRLKELGEDFYSVYPVQGLKESWNSKLLKRFVSDQSDKNQRALEYVMNNYDDMVSDMSKEEKTMEIISVPYNLLEMINMFKLYGDKF